MSAVISGDIFLIKSSVLFGTFVRSVFLTHALGSIPTAIIPQEISRLQAAILIIYNI